MTAQSTVSSAKQGNSPDLWEQELLFAQRLDASIYAVASIEVEFDVGFGERDVLSIDGDHETQVRERRGIGGVSDPNDCRRGVERGCGLSNEAETESR